MEAPFHTTNQVTGFTDKVQTRSPLHEPLPLPSVSITAVYQQKGHSAGEVCKLEEAAEQSLLTPDSSLY